MFVPFIVIVPGMISAVLVPEMIQGKAQGTVDYNNALLYLMRDLLPNGMLGLAIAGLLASFMAGMAANISSFNTVFSYDIWQDYVVKDREDGYYLAVGRVVTVVATVAAMGTAFIAASYTNLMDYLQLLFSFFNAPLFATFILGMFWKKMTPTAGWVGLVSGTLTAIVIAVLSEDAFGQYSLGVLPLTGQGASFVAAGVAFVLDIAISYVVTMATRPKPERELVGLVYSLTPKENFHDPRDARDSWYQKPGLLAGIALVMVIGLNLVFG
jgi:SSS family solute:Na+ symporter